MRKLAGMRVTAGLTQEGVAKALGLNQSSVSVWERGLTKPSLELVPRLAEMYGVTYQDIVDACMNATHTPIVNEKEEEDHE